MLFPRFNLFACPTALLLEDKFRPGRAPRLAAVLLAFVLALPMIPTRAALAGEAADYTREALAKGQWDTAEQELSRRITADAGNDEARFGLAMVRFMRAIEKFGRHHYRYGLDPNILREFQIPFLRFPVPANPKADLLTYEAQRAALQTLLDDLNEVEKTLAGMQGKDVKIAVDLEKVYLDLAPGAQEGGSATLMSVIRAMNPAAARLAVPGAAPFEVAFDKADALWLRGYCHLLAAGAEFVLAHDWHETFNAAGGLFYPRLRPAGEASSLPAEWGITAQIADATALVHLIRWPVIEPARLGKTREHLKQVVALSRQSWKAILAETDDDREWIPGPQQKNAAMPAMLITQERVDTWMAALNDFDAVLDGRMLIPHWRMAKGINLRRVLEEPRTFDLVLWATGHAAVPYLEDGPVLGSQSLAVWQRVFNGDFLLYAAYFN